MKDYGLTTYGDAERIRWPLPSTQMDHDAELDALAAQLEAAGYLVVIPRPDYGVDYQLTPDGARVARQLAMSDEAGQDALMATLLGGSHDEDR